MTVTQFKGEVSIQAQNGQYIPATMVFDSGRRTNLVDQRYVLAMELTADASIPLPTNTRWGNSNNVKTATEVGVRAIQDHKVIEWNTCWKCRLSEGTDDM